MVVDHIQQDLDAGVVQRLDELLELARGRGGALAARPEAAHGGEEGEVGVAPDVDHVIARVGRALELQLVILKHWQQLHSCDAKLHQVRDLSSRKYVMIVI